MSSNDLRVVVVGLGVQGIKRAHIAGNEVVATVDQDKKKKANYINLSNIDTDTYDAVLLCTPDSIKIDLIKEILNNKKHVLVEKPLFANDIKQIEELQKIALNNNLVCYTAYNHRFEPHFINMKNIIAKNDLGKIYRLRMFYGNGTSKLVKESKWRDNESGVILDIGSHLIDTLLFWFNEKNIDIKVSNTFNFENSSPDHALLSGFIDNIFIELEISLVSWKNDFICDVVGEKGSAHIYSLCKWGPSKLVKRTRVLPSGRPNEDNKVLIMPDPTWKEEYKYFKNLILNKSLTDLTNDIKIIKILNNR